MEVEGVGEGRGRAGQINPRSLKRSTPSAKFLSGRTWRAALRAELADHFGAGGSLPLRADVDTPNRGIVDGSGSWYVVVVELVFLRHLVGESGCIGHPICHVQIQ